MPNPAKSSSKLRRRSSPAKTKHVPAVNPRTNQHKHRLPSSSDEETQPSHRLGPTAPASTRSIEPCSTQQPSRRIQPRSAQQPANRIKSTAPASTRPIAPPVACPRTPPLTSDHEILDDSDMDDADHMDNDNAAMEAFNESGDSSHSADENVEVGRKRKKSSRKASKLRKKKLADYETDIEKKAYIEDTCLSLGRYLPRAVELWVDVDDIVWAGLKQAERAEKMNKSVHDMPAKTRNEVSFTVLLKLMECNITFPDIFSVYKTEQIAVKSLIDLLHDGIKEGRATDTNKVWTQILTLMLKDPRTDTITKPAPTSKSSYGFNHIDTGQLLCPQVYLESFDEEYNLLLSLSDSQIEVNTSYWPSFMYDQAMWTPEDEEIGLTRGYLLLRVFLHIFCSNRDPTKQEDKKRCNIAKINRMHQVTGHHIVYAACQTRYVLSSKTAWCEQDGTFNMNTFYVAIVDLFEQYPDDEWVTATLGWWNEQIFGDAEGCTITEAEKQEHASESSVGKIAAAHAARARAEALAMAAESSADDS
ncbi:uncharacterized protein EV420DRAFT_1486520 [Desarmillaria tabescens]|uniref:Uncharacterized protein n=1 Tax=Armillaria tabescens TaxID=1929756 RepID=A0AA39JE04_ARMTA|nr:uncharacterized protein EV420DRAFT_1486520 [Desarmillaria tabescens]KAK0438868.1 hypothetical protein EV420DRAFT_1486520 [Desarmillaria tabescens]